MFAPLMSFFSRTLTLSALVGMGACSSAPKELGSHDGANGHGSESAKENKSAEHHADAEHPHWAYTGKQGPSHWGELQKDYHLCKNGKAQSPVDLHWKKPLAGRKIAFHYEPSALKVIDNGHTIQVNFDKGSWVELQGQGRFDLSQMHFHSRSEHTLSGKGFPLEAHLVHQNAKGQLAVVGIFFKEGKDNAFVSKIWKNLPQNKGQEHQVAGEKLHPIHFLPTVKTHYHYQGSLTTPPCTEGVSWNVLNTPVEMSKHQIEAFRKLYVGNFRPVQKLHGRRPANY